jgi:hypothetical protein
MFEVVVLAKIHQNCRVVSSAAACPQRTTGFASVLDRLNVHRLIDVINRD